MVHHRSRRRVTERNESSWPPAVAGLFLLHMLFLVCTFPGIVSSLREDPAGFHWEEIAVCIGVLILTVLFGLLGWGLLLRRRWARLGGIALMLLIGAGMAVIGWVTAIESRGTGHYAKLGVGVAGMVGVVGIYCGVLAFGLWRAGDESDRRRRDRRALSDDR